MEFARRQLEKYGWSEGKGLGRHENGISKALRPKLKRSSAGVGHEASADFTDHWWSALYDKASSNIEVEDSNGRTKKIKTVDPEAVEISDKTWKINGSKKIQKNKKSEGYMEHFIKTAVLTSGGSKTQRLLEDSDDDVSNVTDFNVTGVKLTDEELFAACGGRTAHKGARHGLRAIGKLARIEQQEKDLLTLPQYEGYSHSKLKKTQSKKLKNICTDNPEKIDEDSLEEEMPKDKKKRWKKKYCKGLRGYDGAPLQEDIELSKKEIYNTGEDSKMVPELEQIEIENVIKKNKKNKTKHIKHVTESGESETMDSEPNKEERDSREDSDRPELEQIEAGNVIKKTKNKKNKKAKLINNHNIEEDNVDNGIEIDEHSVDVRKSKKKKRCAEITNETVSTELAENPRKHKKKKINKEVNEINLNEMNIGEKIKENKRKKIKIK